MSSRPAHWPLLRGEPSLTRVVVGKPRTAIFPLIPLSVMSDADAAEIDRVRDTLKELRREHFERVKLQLKGAGTG